MPGISRICPRGDAPRFLRNRLTMTVVPVAERMTAEKFLELPVPQRGRPWNLVNGEVVVNDPRCEVAPGDQNQQRFIGTSSTRWAVA